MQLPFLIRVKPFSQRRIEMPSRYVASMAGTPALGARRGSCPLCPHPWGAGEARIALHTEFLPSLLSFEGAFSSISGSLLQENFSGGKPPDPHTTTKSLGD